MSTKYKLNIAKPCSENWNDMTPALRGKFCQQCSKNVVDFSTMSDKQIVDYLKKGEKSICARIDNSQMSRAIIAQPNNSGIRNSFYKYLLGIFLFGLNGKSFSKNHSEQLKSQTKKIENLDQKKTENLKVDNSGSELKLIGKVKDAENELTLSNAHITLENDSVIQVCGKSDTSGNFSISVPAPGNYIVRVSHEDYNSKIYRNVKIMRHEVTNLEIELDYSSIILEEDVIVSAEPLIDPDNTSTGHVRVGKWRDNQPRIRNMNGEVYVDTKDNKWWKFWRKKNNH